MRLLTLLALVCSAACFQLGGLVVNSRTQRAALNLHTMAISADSTLAEMKAYVKDNDLKVKLSGKGRNKSAILADIQALEADAPAAEAPAAAVEAPAAPPAEAAPAPEPEPEPEPEAEEPAAAPPAGFEWGYEG